MGRALLRTKKNRHLVALELSRYFVVGGLAFACDFLSYLGLTELVGMNYLIANVIGFGLGLSVNYLLSICWVFSQRSESSVKKEFLVFAGIGLFNLGIGELCLWGLVDLAGLHHVPGKIAITALVFFSNFSMRKVRLFHVQST